MAKKKATAPKKPIKRKTEAKSRTTRGGTGKRTPRKQTTSRRKPASPKSNGRSLSLNDAQKILLVGILIIFITVIMVLSLLSPQQGELTKALAGLMGRTFGWGSFLLPLITGGIGLYLVMWGMEQPPNLPMYRLAGGGLLYFAFLGLASLALLLLENNYFTTADIATAETGGGALGSFMAILLMTAVGNLGAIFILTVVAVLGVILVSGVTREDMGHFLQALFSKRPSLPKPTFNNPRASRDLPINRPQRTPVTEASQPRLIPDPPTAAAAVETAVPPPPPPQPQTKPPPPHFDCSTPFPGHRPEPHPGGGGKFKV